MDRRPLAAKTGRVKNRLTSVRHSKFLAGQPNLAFIRNFAELFDKSEIFVETHTMEGLQDLNNVRHISEFGPEPGDQSPRAEARDRVAALSAATIQRTGLPVWQSFQYRGVNAWWFLEIIFHEPAYLNWRRLQALGKIERVLGAEPSAQLVAPMTNTLPVVPQPRMEAIARFSFRKWLARRRTQVRSGIRYVLGRLARRWMRLRFFADIPSCDVLCIVEHENLRRHVDSNGSIVAVLPYAEGVVERLHQKLGDRCMVLTRAACPYVPEGWGFLGPHLPPVLLKPLPDGFEEALEEVFALAAPLIDGYLTLEALKENLIFRLAEYDMYIDLLRHTKPKAIFAYNWEGVFRPLIAAARTAGVKVIGVQQALGPYLHALDHHEVGYCSSSNAQGFAIPDRLAVWGDLHRRELLKYGYPESAVTTTGYARLDKHFEAGQNCDARDDACKRLGLPPYRRYLLFTGQSRVLDTALLRSENFTSTIKILVRLAEKYDFSIILKPWTSDDMTLINEAIRTYSEFLYLAPQNVAVGNAELLSVSEWAVGTFSSILGEASLLGNACVLLNYAESRYYFDLPHVHHYRAMMPFADHPEDLEAILRPLLEDEELRVRQARKAQAAMADLFGMSDGQAAHRIADIVLTEAGVHA